MADDPSVVEARSRLLSVLSVLEHEGDALHDLDDTRLVVVLQAMQHAKAEIVTALASLGSPPQNGGG